MVMKRILVIEDDVPLSWLIERMLRDKYAVTLTDNGLEASSWLMDGTTFDLIISDIYMPALNGFELLEYLKESRLFNDIPVIIISSIDDYRKQCMDLGAFAYLEKPFEPQQLFAHIEEALDVQRKFKPCVPQ
jgi:DNA-binding NtrC family response regulator